MSPQSTSEWIGWDSGCWDRPDGVHSLALSFNNGHKFSGINKSCKEWMDDGWKGKDQAEVKDLKVAKFEEGKDKGHHHCNVFPGHEVKAVIYHW